MSDRTRDEPDSHSTREPIGLVGVGLLGTAIASRLIQANWTVIGWDLNSERGADLTRLGGESVSRLNDVFVACRRIFLSLPDDSVVARVLGSVSGSLRVGQTILDTSTGDPNAARQQAKYLESLEISYLDATVSGSSQQLRDGEASLLVGATEPAFGDCHDLLSALSTRIFHTGPPGTGATLKLVTNLVLGLNRAALAEGLVFAETLGVDLNAALDVLRGSMAYSRIMDTKGRKMIDGDFSAQARLSQHLKDVRLMLAAAGASGQGLPLSETHRKLLEHGMSAGRGDLDNSVLIQSIRECRS